MPFFLKFKKIEMRNLITIVLLLLLSFCIKSHAQDLNKEKQSNITILKNAKIVDVESGRIMKDTDVVLQNGSIREIGRDIVQTGNEKVIDLSGKYVIPGLIDTHTHLSYGQTRDELAKQMEYLVKHGITSVRDVGGDARQLSEIKMAIDSYQLPGPSIYYSAFIATADYYRNATPQKSWIRGITDSEFAPWVQQVSPGDNLDLVMASAKATGATGVKIYLGYDKEYLKELVTYAKKLGLEVWSHAMLFPAKPSEVAASGVKVLSHAYMLEWEALKNPGKNYQEAEAQMHRNKEDYGKVNLDAFVNEAKKNKIILDATLYISLQTGAYPHAVEIIRRLYKSGIKISAGTDWFVELNKPFPKLFTEIDYLVEKCGFSNMDALRAATIIAAETFNDQGKKGSVKVGKDADLIILSDDPVRDIKNIQKIEAVIAKGRIINIIN